MLVTVCGAFFLDALDNIMVGIALPPIQAAFGMSADAAQWVVSSYVLAFGGFLLLGGRLADKVGRRRIFLIGVALFIAGSVLAGAAVTGGMVIAGRFVMGVGAAFTAPAALAIITGSFEAGPARNRALGIYTACGAIGYSTGVVAGGLLTEIGWRWVYFLPLLPAFVALVGAAVFVSKDGAMRQDEGYDIWGAITCTAGMLGIVYAIVELPSRGMQSPFVIGTALLAILSLTAFIQIEKRIAHPLLDLSLLTNKKLVWASIVAAAILGTYMSFQFIGTLYLQANRGWSPIEMAFAFLPIGLLIAFLAPLMGRLIERFGVHWMITAGFVAYALSYANFLRIGEDSSYLWVVLPSIMLIGIAFPLSFPAANVLATTGIEEDKRGVAAGILQTGYQLGAALVLAITTAVMGGDSQRLEIAQYHAGLWLLLGISVATIACSLIVTFLARDKRYSD